MGFFYGRIYTTSLAKKSGTTPKVNQQVSKERDALHLHIVQVFQLTFSPNMLGTVIL